MDARLYVGSMVCLFSMLLSTVQAWSMPPHISRGHPLPDATLVGTDDDPYSLRELKGRVKILSIVPQLNTPVCDEQTHRFSEKNEGLEQHLEIVTISTNTQQDQMDFAGKAGIANITFLSDSPDFELGNQTGLLYPEHRILQRAVMVVDEDNVIRYLEIVPMGQFPHFAAALDAARRVLGLSS